MAEIGLNKIEKHFGANHLLRDITFEINAKDRMGLLGKNGTGKTTLFKIILGKEPYDGGSLFIKKNLKIGHLRQIPKVTDGISAVDVLRKGFSEIYEVSHELQKLELKMEYDHSDSTISAYHNLQTKYELIGGYDIDERISRIMSGLNIDTAVASRDFNLLSGGEKTRVSLARLLLSDPDILLLDEPTNHLDLPAVEWLEEYLSKYSGSVIVISHDRYFLDMTVNKIVEIENGVAGVYRGNYTAFEIDKQRLLLEQANLYKREERELKKLNESYEGLKRISARNNKFKKRAESIKKRVEKIEEHRVEKPLYEKNLKLSIDNKKFSGKEIVKIENLCKSFAGNIVLDNLDFMLYRNTAAGIIGANGTGKTTLLNIITGRTEPDMGYYKLGNSVEYIYLEQEPGFRNEKLSILELITEHFNISDGEARSIAARFMFTGDDVFKPITALSGGERKRLSLCLLLGSEKNLLILDEPTNHLDISSRKSLEDALEQFKCSMLFISHDRYFINKFADKTYELSAGKLRGFDGDYDFYRKEKRKEREKKQINKNTRLTSSQKERIEKKKSEKKQKQKDRIEREIYDTETLLENLRCEMDEFVSDHEKLIEIQSKIDSLTEKLETLYENWS